MKYANFLAPLAHETDDEARARLRAWAERNEHIAKTMAAHDYLEIEIAAFTTSASVFRRAVLTIGSPESEIGRRANAEVQPTPYPRAAVMP